jgi:peptidoglycan/xylan/chitin deacetylase (PgdA/CDA1 family)
MRVSRPLSILRWFYPDALFRLDTDEKQVCLTFDDGPDPESTHLILDILNSYGIRAVFFCTGQNVRRHPEILKIITSRGHLAGNHGYSHFDGWKIKSEKYIEDVEKAVSVIPGNLFRPPYGRLMPGQYLHLKKKFRIFFWDIMPYDYDLKISWQQSYQMLIKNLRTGSIIALHDKPESSCHKYLAMFIEESLKKGYSFVHPDNISGS